MVLDDTGNEEDIDFSQYRPAFGNSLPRQSSVDAGDPNARSLSHSESQPINVKSMA